MVYCILVLFLQSWAAPHMRNFLENRPRKDDLTRQCCPLPGQRAACFSGIVSSTVLVLIVEIPCCALPAEESGTVSQC